MKNTYIYIKTSKSKLQNKVSCLVLFLCTLWYVFLNKMSLWEKSWWAEKVAYRSSSSIIVQRSSVSFGYSKIHSSRWWFTEVVGVVNHVVAATKIEVGWVKDLKSYLILVVGKWKCVLIDKVGVSQKMFHVLSSWS